LSVDEQLAWEARHRPRVAAAAIGGALLTFAANAISGTTLTGAPGVSSISALEQAAQPGPVSETQSLRTETYQYLQDNSGELLLAAATSMLGYLCVAYAITYLAFATRARRPEVSKPIAYIGLVGAVLYGLFSLVAQIAQQSAIGDFLDGPRTVQAATDVGGSGLLVFAQILYIPAVLALGMGFVFVSLNAMRAGLLTRFMGALGIMLGVFLVLPLLPYGATLIQVFWLAGLGLLFLRRWPGGTPEAWESGEARPWPTARSMREAREAETGGGGAGPVLEPPAAEEARAAEEEQRRPHPSSKKRKRKRRS
jgi:hypothetical protein